MNMINDTDRIRTNGACIVSTGRTKIPFASFRSEDLYQRRQVGL